VTENLRAVTVTYGERTILLEAYFNGEIAEEDKESMSLVETELVAAFPEDHDIKLDLIMLPMPQLIPKNKTWAFHRKEPLLD